MAKISRIDRGPLPVKNDNTSAFFHVDIGVNKWRINIIAIFLNMQSRSRIATIASRGGVAAFNIICHILSFVFK